MIKRCKVENFKSLKSSELKNLKRINLFGGKNNTGKTTLMEALFLFQDRLNPECFLRLHSWRGVGLIQKDTSELYAPFFYEYNTDKAISIEVEEFNLEIKKLKINLKNDNQKSISLNNFKLSNIDSSTKVINNDSLEMTLDYSGKGSGKSREHIIHKFEEDNNFNVNVKNVRPNEVRKAVFLVAKQLTNYNENAVRFGELVKENTENEILNFLKIIEPRLSSISTIQLRDNTSTLYGDIGLKKKIPLNYMGDGITRILSILLAIIDTRNGIVFIDEIENGIHHSVMKEVWSMIDKASKKYNCQVFVTTHSYECLASLLEGAQESKDELSYVRLERVGNEIKSKEYDYEMLEIAIKQGWEVR